METSVSLPIDFAEANDALRANLETRKAALAHLGQGGAIRVSPEAPFRRRQHHWRSQWIRTGAALPRWIAKSDAVVVPVYFDGGTLRVFRGASHLHATQRMGLLIKTFHQRNETPQGVVIAI